PQPRQPLRQQIPALIQRPAVIPPRRQPDVQPQVVQHHRGPLPDQAAHFLFRGGKVHARLLAAPTAKTARSVNPVLNSDSMSRPTPPRRSGPMTRELTASS